MSEREVQINRVDLRNTEEFDLGYVLTAEADNDNRPYIIPWSYEEHLQAIADPNIAHLIVQDRANVGYVILAGILNPHGSIELRRIVITEKGKGYGKVIVEIIKKLAFETYSAHRLWLDVKSQNYRAQAVYEAAGFGVEGTLRECLKAEDGYESLIIMSILQQEYEKSKGISTQL